MQLSNYTILKFDNTRCIHINLSFYLSQLYMRFHVMVFSFDFAYLHLILVREKRSKPEQVFYYSYTVTLHVSTFMYRSLDLYQHFSTCFNTIVCEPASVFLPLLLLSITALNVYSKRVTSILSLKVTFSMKKAWSDRFCFTFYM